MNPAIKWTLIALGAIAALALAYWILNPKAPVVAPGGGTALPVKPANSWITSIISSFGPGVANWLFPPSNSGGCELGVASADDPCIDKCGFMMPNC